jgi:hypothetical protein
MKVESDIAFPELIPWEGGAEAPFEIEFRIGLVDHLKDTQARGFTFEAHGPDQIVFLIENVGRARVEDGCRIVFESLPGVGLEKTRLNLIGTIQAALWHQRGYLPLHASAVMVGERAIAVGGPTRGGKSVIAAALTTRGCPLVADDFTIVDWSQDPPVVLPGYQKLRLWKDACLELDLLGAAVGRAHPVLEKYIVAAEAYAEPALPLSDLFMLAGERGNELEIERLGPIQGIQNLLAALHMPDQARALGRQSQIFSGLNAVASSVNLWLVTAPDDLSRALDIADAILARVASEAN